MRAVLASALGWMIISSAYSQTASASFTEHWGTWLIMGYDPVTEKQTGLMSGFDALGDCVESITEGKKGYITPMPAQEMWPKLVLYCVPADVVPVEGVGILPKKGR